MHTRLYLLHALAPLHAGTGQAVDVIDLPIARLRATGMPFVPGSSIKGVLREACEAPSKEVVFGPETPRASEHAGALVVSDARLLALPVRSFRGTFAWVTSPLVLGLARRDLEELPDLPPIPTVGEPATRAALVAAGSINTHEHGGQRKLYLEDLDLPAKVDAADGHASKWAELLAPLVAGDMPELFLQRLAVVDDETMTFLWESATQVDVRVRIGESRTVETGALWSEESLPPETLLVGTLAATRGFKDGTQMSATEVLDVALPDQGTRTLQFGGKATVGRGRCRMVSLEK